MHWNIDDRVLANWTHDEYWYPATVREVDDERVYIYFDDGDKEWTTAERLMAVDIEPGDRVHCRWKDGPYYYPGRVTQIAGEKLHVRYDDGDEEWTTLRCLRVTR